MAKKEIEKIINMGLISMACFGILGSIFILFDNLEKKIFTETTLIGILIIIFSSIMGISLGIVLKKIILKKPSAKLFISYSKADDSFVRKLITDLRRYGYRPLLPEDEILIGDNLQQKLNEIIKESDFFITILSKESIENNWIKREWLFAKENNKMIIPVIIDEITIPNEFDSIKYADFKNAYKEPLKSMIKSIESKSNFS